MGLPGAFRGAFGPLGRFVVWMRALLPCLTSSEAVLGARPVGADAVKQSRRRGSAGWSRVENRYKNVGQEREPLCRRPQAPWKYRDRIAFQNGVQARRAVGELRGPSKTKQRHLEKHAVFHKLVMDLLSWGSCWRHIEGFFGACWGFLGASWGPLGSSWGHLRGLSVLLESHQPFRA